MNFLEVKDELMDSLTKLYDCNLHDFIKEYDVIAGFTKLHYFMDNMLYCTNNIDILIVTLYEIKTKQLKFYRLSDLVTRLKNETI